MSARLILLRHGNTFKPEETPVMAGARTDLPLVEKGLAQAHAVADTLAKAKLIPDAIFTGPLQRTAETARIIASKLGFPAEQIRTERRLCEIDYGTWEGKTNAQIEAMGDGDELTAWNKQSIFPMTPRWQPIEAQIGADIFMLMSQLTDGLSLLITSNGILRFFARAAINADAFPEPKVATGNGCVMDYDGDAWRIAGWNLTPAALAAQIAA